MATSKKKSKRPPRQLYLSIPEDTMDLDEASHWPTQKKAKEEAAADSNSSVTYAVVGPYVLAERAKQR